MIHLQLKSVSSNSVISSRQFHREIAWEIRRKKTQIHPLHRRLPASSSSTQEVELAASDEEKPFSVGERKYGSKKKEEFGCLIKEYGWKVRRLVETEDEIKMVARVQAEAFHQPMAFLNELFFEFFLVLIDFCSVLFPFPLPTFWRKQNGNQNNQNSFYLAEVLSGLLYRLRNSPPDRYATLVAEPIISDEDHDCNSPKEIAGVVDLTMLRDADVLKHLLGADEYLYVSGIGVLNKYRRRKVATVLLKACDVISIIWGSEFLVLRAYEDDLGARRLYSDAGYRVVSRDPPWLTTWVGRRRRVLMVKSSAFSDQTVTPQSSTN